MISDLRKSLDTVLVVEQMLRIKLRVLGIIISTEPNLEDSLVVYIAEIYNQTVAEIAGLTQQIENITEQMKLFGEEGLEKELEFIPDEQEEDEMNKRKTMKTLLNWLYAKTICLALGHSYAFDFFSECPRCRRCDQVR